MRSADASARPGVVLSILPVDGPVADVPTVIHAVPADALHDAVGELLSVRDAIAQRHGAQYPPAGGAHLACIAETRAGEKL